MNKTMKSDKMSKKGHRVCFYNDGVIQVPQTQLKTRPSGYGQFPIIPDRQRWFASYKDLTRQDQPKY